MNYWHTPWVNFKTIMLSLRRHAKGAFLYDSIYSEFQKKSNTLGSEKCTILRVRWVWRGIGSNEMALEVMLMLITQL